MRQGKLKKYFFWVPALAGLTLQLVLLSCTKERRNVIGVSSSSGPSGPATLSTIQVDIIRLGCSVSGCHDNRATPASNLNFTSADLTYSAIVSRVSSQVPQMVLVDPGHADQSYLINKLRGTHLSVGGTGDRMPQYAAALSEGDIQRIEDWITNGAQKN